MQAMPRGSAGLSILGMASLHAPEVQERGGLAVLLPLTTWELWAEIEAKVNDLGRSLQSAWRPSTESNLAARGLLFSRSVIR
jgi:hypothetical protein